MAWSPDNPRQRVVITGLGVVAPNGIGKETFWQALIAGRSGIDWITSFDTSGLYCRIAGQVKDFDARDYMSKRGVRMAGRFAHFSVAASRLAVEDAGLEPSRVDPYRMGAIFGTSLAGVGNISDDMYHRFETQGPDGIVPSMATEMAAHAATSHVFIELGFKGPNSTSAAGCVASLDSIAVACDVLRAGQADVMIAGGTEACISPGVMALLCKQRVLTHHNSHPGEASRHYDHPRDGLVLSEGGGAVILETLEHARERGATIYAEVRGYSSATEAKRMIAAEQSGDELAYAFETALLSGRVAAEQIDYVCAHGIGTREYDIADTNAIKKVLGERAHNVPVSSIKSIIGQSFAAGGAFQVVSSCMTLTTGIIPPTINYRVPDPACDLDYVPNQARRARVDMVMTNSHSFGGTHAALILGRCAN